MQGLLKLFTCRRALPAVPDYDPVIRELEDPQRLVIPLDYPKLVHYLPTVEAGDSVRRGEVIGRSPLGNCLLAGISGKVTEISSVWTAQSEHSDAVIIENDGGDPLRADEMFDGPVPDDNPAAALERIRAAGVNAPWSMSGRDYEAGEIHELPPIEAVIIAGVQEETTILSSELLLEQNPEKVAEGLRRVRLLLPEADIWLTVPERLHDWAENRFAEYAQIAPLPPSYPERIEREVVARLLGRRIPNRRSYISEGIVVQDVENLLAMVDALDGVSPFVDKCLTISGTNIDKAVTVRFPMGTSLKHILDSQGLTASDYTRFVVGGPMKGIAQYSDETPLTFNHGIYLVDYDLAPFDPIAPCVFCGQCTRICPADIQVHLLNRMVEFGKLESAMNLHPEACHECGLCAHVCPAQRPIVQLLHFCNHEMTHGDRFVWEKEGGQ